jgi:preprotein translocase subunit SecA
MRDYGLDMSIQKNLDDGMDVEELLRSIVDGMTTAHNVREKVVGSETMRVFEKAVMLRSLDTHWKEHLAIMDQLRQSVNLRGYGQKNPVQEFKREAFAMFTDLLELINTDTVKNLSNVELMKQNRDEEVDTTINKKQIPGVTEKTVQPIKSQKIKAPKVGRNDPCPCGSGKKFKQCHG